MRKGSAFHVALALAALATTALLVEGLPVAAGGGDTFVVRSIGNGGDVNLSDDTCDASPDPAIVRCTLRKRTSSRTPARMGSSCRTTPG